MWVCEISLYIVSKRMTLTVKKKWTEISIGIGRLDIFTKIDKYWLLPFI